MIIIGAKVLSDAESGRLVSALLSGAEIEKLYTTAEFADWLGLSAITVRQWAATRKIESVRVGPRAIRIPGRELVRLIEAGYSPRRDQPSATP